MITVVIPVYNSADTLLEALRSLAGQTYRPLNIIIVDDGSDIPVSEKQKEIEACFINITEISFQIIRQENGGAPAARNTGKQYAKGEYMIFWDADIIAKPNMLEFLHQALQKHPEASFSYGNFYFGSKAMPAQEWDMATLEKRNYISTASLVRAKVLSDRPWDESLARFQDWDLWLSLAREGKHGVWVNEYVYRALVDKKGISTWLPSFAYRFPWKYLPWWKKSVQEYEQARSIIQEKYHLE